MKRYEYEVSFSTRDGRIRLDGKVEAGSLQMAALKGVNSARKQSGNARRFNRASDLIIEIEEILEEPEEVSE